MLWGERINSWICFTATVQPQYVPSLTLPHPPLPRHLSVIWISSRGITQSRVSRLRNWLIVCWAVERLNCSSETCPRQFLNCCLVSLNCLCEFSSSCWNSVSCLWEFCSCSWTSMSCRCKFCSRCRDSVSYLWELCSRSWSSLSCRCKFCSRYRDSVRCLWALCSRSWSFLNCLCKVSSRCCSSLNCLWKFSEVRLVEFASRRSCILSEKIIQKGYKANKITWVP